MFEVRVERLGVQDDFWLFIEGNSGQLEILKGGEVYLLYKDFFV